MLENLSRASSSLLLGVGGRCLVGSCEEEEDGICGEDFEIPDENEVDLNSSGVYEEELDKLEGDDWSLLLEALNDPACLTGEIFLEGDSSLPVVLVVDLFLSMEWVITRDPFPVYNLSPMDMMVTI